MNVAWVSHRPWDPANGGAEAADFAMHEQRPEGTHVTLLGPGAVTEDELDQYDRVVVTGIWGFSSRELNILGRLHPIFWVHDCQVSGHWFYGEVSKLILLSPPHIDYELSKLPIIRKDRIFLNPGPMNVNEIRNARRSDKKDLSIEALWAHRPEPHKGLDLAAQWAKENHVELEVLVNAPRLTVLQKMWSAQQFVLLSHIFDPGPRAIMEAQIQECRLVINENVGYWEDDDQLFDILENSASTFWALVLDD
jgi:glycosyltransferase involved in cell wall biosynthesis